jgi:predicted amidophosphoribosyltransferase
MNSINISFAVFVFLISLLAMLRIRNISHAKAYNPGYGSQRMCRACGSITPRAEACCLQCGKPLPVI